MTDMKQDYITLTTDLSYQIMTGLQSFFLFYFPHLFLIQSLPTPPRSYS